jgi:hypothetical protein
MLKSFSFSVFGYFYKLIYCFIRAQLWITVPSVSSLTKAFWFYFWKEVHVKDSKYKKAKIYLGQRSGEIFASYFNVVVQLAGLVLSTMSK